MLLESNKRINTGWKQQTAKKGKTALHSQVRQIKFHHSLCLPLRSVGGEGCFKSMEGGASFERKTL